MNKIRFVGVLFISRYLIEMYVKILNYCICNRFFEELLFLNFKLCDLIYFFLRLILYFLIFDLWFCISYFVLKLEIFNILEWFCLYMRFFLFILGYLCCVSEFCFFFDLIVVLRMFYCWKNCGFCVLVFLFFWCLFLSGFRVVCNSFCFFLYVS